MRYILEAMELAARLACLLGGVAALIAVIPAVGFRDFVAAGVCGVAGVLFLAAFIWLDDEASHPG